MNKAPKKTINIIKALAALCVLVLIAGLIIRFIIGIALNVWLYFAERLSNLDTVVLTALITGCVSITSVALSSIVGRILEYHQTTKRYLYEKREEPYSQFIELVYKIQDKSRTGGKYNEADMTSDFIKFSKKLTLWGSDNVIRKWLKFRELSLQHSNNSAENLFYLEDIIFEIRKDMGQKNKRLKQGDLLAFFVNDIYNYIPNKNKQNKAQKL